MAYHRPREDWVVTFTRIQLAPDEPTPTLIDGVPDPRGWTAIFDQLTSTNCEITNGGLWEGLCGRIEGKPGEALLIMRKPFQLSPSPGSDSSHSIG
jgi:hypothetical protein